MPSPPVLLAVPFLLTALRLLLAPFIVLAALYWPMPVLFGTFLAIAFVSDIFDGILARRLNVATPRLRRFDSATDTLFYLAVAFAVWHLHPGAIKQRIVPLAGLATLELIRHAVDFAKFRREASYHMWSSKLWGIILFAACFSLLALHSAGGIFSIAIYAGYFNDLEGLAISLTLPAWQCDVPTLVHARRIRRTARVPRSE